MHENLNMPQAVEAEKSILSSMMRNPVDFIARAEEARLTPDHFYVPMHAELYSIFTKFYAKNRPIELVGLTQYLKDKKLLDQLGGAGAITDVWMFAATSANFDHHLSLVKDKHILRSLIKTNELTTRECFENDQEVAQLLDRAEQAVLQIRNSNETNSQITVKEAALEVMQNLSDFMAGRNDGQGLKTNYAELDKLSNGLKAAEMFVIAARPSMGKTSFMMNIIEHLAIDQQLASMVFSCEMSSIQLIQRLIFARARAEYGRIMNGFKPSKGDLAKIQRAVKEISTSKLFIDDTAGISINELRAKARRKDREVEGGLQLIAIDYLQLLKSHSKQAQNAREREISEISAGIKALAKELNIPIIVLAQLNRGPENRGGLPRMSDLRESGAIEQDADLIGLLYREEYYADTDEQKEESAGKAKLILAKNRNGATGLVPLTFRSTIMRFENRAKDPNEEE